MSTHMDRDFNCLNTWINMIRSLSVYLSISKRKKKYNVDVEKHKLYLVVTSVMVQKFAALFNCTSGRRNSIINYLFFLECLCLTLLVCRLALLILLILLLGLAVRSKIVIFVSSY